MNMVEPTIQIDNQNKVLTYIAIPVEALQECNGQNFTVLSDTQSLLFKAFSETDTQLQVENESGTNICRQPLRIANLSQYTAKTGIQTVIDTNKYNEIRYVICISIFPKMEYPILRIRPPSFRH
uniref:Uncharacterized protein n=1 Tax=Photinus pyralis TaxID=7054 RepID=A0A1Y1K4T5_PHOPY